MSETVDQLRQSILAHRALPIVSVTCWGRTVRIKTMTGAERDEWEQGWMRWRKERGTSPDDTRHFHSYLLAHVIVDDAGARLFSDSDVEALSATSCREIHRASSVGCRLNGIGSDEVDALVKNSERAESDDSGTG